MRQIIYRILRLFHVYNTMCSFLASFSITLFKTPDGNKFVVLSQQLVDEIYEHKVYDSALPQKGDIVFDVGAHIGIYSLRVAKIIGCNGIVFALEPEKTNYKLLSKHIEINKAENVTPINKALSNKKGTARLFLSDHYSSRNHSLVVEESKFTLIETTTWDELLENLGVHKPDIAKIDVEGAEPLVIQGMNKNLPKTMIIGSYHYPTEAEEVKELLTRRGYKTEQKIINGDDYILAKKVVGAK